MINRTRRITPYRDRYMEKAENISLARLGMSVGFAAGGFVLMSGATTGIPLFCSPAAGTLLAGALSLFMESLHTWRGELKGRRPFRLPLPERIWAIATGMGVNVVVWQIFGRRLLAGDTTSMVASFVSGIIIIIACRSTAVFIKVAHEG